MMIENVPSNDENQISVTDFALAYGLRKQSVFKVIKRLGINTIQKRGEKRHRGQFVAYLSNKDAEMILADIFPTNGSQKAQRETISEIALYDIGVFYLIQLEPEHDPNRIKVGFANNLDERLRQHRCAAPFAQVLKSWPCRRLWEKTVIECVTVDCECLHTEVFRASSLENVIEKCSQFFSLMPSLSETDKQNPDIPQRLCDPVGVET